MAIARVFAAQPTILDGSMVAVEADLSRGLHSFSVVGLATKAVDEARDRVSAAVKNSGFPSPKSKNHKIIVSLAPADLKKEGPRFDLAIALAYLIAAQEMRATLDETLLLGELALDGTLRPVRGVLPCVRAAQRAGYQYAIVPSENAREAALAPGIKIYAAQHLTEVVRHCDTSHVHHRRLEPTPSVRRRATWPEPEIRFEDIRGHEGAKRGLCIAAAGRHNALMIGPPGTGKTMLARAFRGILPPLSPEETLDATAIHSVAGVLHEPVVAMPPFRAPHHTASHTAIVGGGPGPRPGEISLAHHGVLFLDELALFERRCLDALREPLEARTIAIARAQQAAQFPADFILLAAMNPHRGTDSGERDMRAAMLDTYMQKLSGPILDRIDIWLDVPRIASSELERKAARSDETEQMRATVMRARDMQRTRLAHRTARSNAEMSARDVDELIERTDTVNTILSRAAERLRLSPRGYHRVLKVARTIADLAESEHIHETHVLEALGYRGAH